MSKRAVWVVKIGSSLVTNHGKGIDHDAIANWCRQIIRLEHDFEIDTVIVCSGSIAEGIVRLGWQKKPRDINKLQAAAAVGQAGLVQAWQDHFEKFNKITAQILLTHGDIADRKRYINSRSTLKTLLAMNIVSIVNENDTVTTEEIKLGDNDNLGAMVANLVEADRLILLTDQDGLMDKDPRVHPNAVLIKEGYADDEKLLSVAGEGGRFGSGGMRTKILAARRAASSGCTTHIANGKMDDILINIAKNQAVTTTLLPKHNALVARKQWLLGLMHSKGELVVDDGASNVLVNSGKSLLPVGVIAVKGQFERGDLVTCTNKLGHEIARGLVNYDSASCEKLIGKPSSEIEQILGYCNDIELVHRDNLVVT